MADAEEKPPNSRRGTFGTASRRSSRTTRTGSRPSSPSRQMSRILSGNHLDDHGHYLHHPYDEEAIADEESPDADLEERDREVEEEDITPSSDEVYENRDGIEDIRDVESGPTLQKTKSRKSMKSTKSRDPNLVTWEGPDDVENPKNWAFSRKWAATIIGTFSMRHFARMATNLLQCLHLRSSPQYRPQWSHQLSLPSPRISTSPMKSSCPLHSRSSSLPMPWDRSSSARSQKCMDVSWSFNSPMPSTYVST